MNINGIHGANGANPIRPTNNVKKESAAQRPVQSRDEMDVQKTNEINIQNVDTSDVRVDLVNRVRAQIAAGNYDTPERLEIALNRMFDSFLG